MKNEKRKRQASLVGVQVPVKLGSPYSSPDHHLVDKAILKRTRGAGQECPVWKAPVRRQWRSNLWSVPTQDQT